MVTITVGVTATV